MIRVWLRISAIAFATCLIATSSLAQWVYFEEDQERGLQVQVQVQHHGTEAVASIRLMCADQLATLAVFDGKEPSMIFEGAENILIEYWPSNFREWASFGRIPPRVSQGSLRDVAVWKFVREVALHDRSVATKRLRLAIQKQDAVSYIVFGSDEFLLSFAYWNQLTDVDSCLEESAEKSREEDEAVVSFVGDSLTGMMESCERDRDPHACSSAGGMLIALDPNGESGLRSDAIRFLEIACEGDIQTACDVVKSVAARSE